MENLIINNINYGSFIIEDNVLVLTSDSRKILTVLPSQIKSTVEKRMVLNHNGTREDRKRAFEQNDYTQKGWTITFDLSILDLIK